MSETAGLHVPTDEEVAALDPSVRAQMAAAFLKGVEPGRQPLDLFIQLCRVAVIPTVEVVPIRPSHEGPEVWLDQRSEDDPWWASKWALPGTVILPNDAYAADNGLEGPLARLFASELDGIRRVGDLHQMPTQFRHGGRGSEITVQYWTCVETGDEPYQGQFFNVEGLRESEPEGGVLQEGWLTIDRAIAGYEASHEPRT